jgi:hypothetical protein
VTLADMANEPDPVVTSPVAVVRKGA